VAAEPKEDPQEIVVGSFGVPGPSKLTHVIIDAVERLHRKGLKVRLIIAGFSAKRYAEAMQDQARGLNISVFDGPTDVQLATAMAAVDIAVQLRAINLGESSGVVPQLLAMSKRVIVSPVGSFLEFGDAVTFAPQDVTAESLAQLIEEAFRSPASAEPAARYVSDRTPEKFRVAFLAALARLAEARGPASRGNKSMESAVSSP
jgi:glycosyltransferase involved in cell wall biosynthesis